MAMNPCLAVWQVFVRISQCESSIENINARSEGSAALIAAMTHEFLTLSSGRKLAFQHFGDPAGVPAFYFHGWPSSLVQGALMDEQGKRQGLHVVAMDRPGVGRSDHQPGRRLLDWPPVVIELADHLGWDRFHVFGVSGGGPYALACAHAIPDRLLSASVICGAPPLRLFGSRELFFPYRLVLAMSHHLPWLLSPLFHIASAISRCPAHLPPLSWMIAMLSGRDREALQDREAHRIICQSFRDCLASGVPQVQADGDVYHEDWGIDFSQIRCPVHLWHGTKDRNIPCSYAEKLAALMPAAITHWTPDDGHYSLPLLRGDEIARAALGR
jgi:pimeloyl-ACP methyl ester carboxylesterase